MPKVIIYREYPPKNKNEETIYVYWSGGTHPLLGVGGWTTERSGAKEFDSKVFAEAEIQEYSLSKKRTAIIKEV